MFYLPVRNAIRSYSRFDNILPLKLRVDYSTTWITPDGSLYIFRLIGAGDIPMII